MKRKVYTRVVLDMTQDDFPVIESESYEYEGPMTLCWGGVGADGHDGREGGGGSFGNDSSHGVGPSGMGGNNSGGGNGDGRGGGWGDSPHGNPRGTLGPSPDNYGGRSPGLSSPSAHSGMSGLGYGLDNPRAVRETLNPSRFSRQDRKEISAARSRAMLNDEWGNKTFMEKARTIGYYGREAFRGLAGMMGIGSGNPVGMAMGAKGLHGVVSRAQANQQYRDALGLPATMTAEEVAQASGVGADQGRGGEPDIGGPAPALPRVGAASGLAEHPAANTESVLAEIRQMYDGLAPEAILAAMDVTWEGVEQDISGMVIRSGLNSMAEKRRAKS